jgi:flagellar basal body-associated protein FliL
MAADVAEQTKPAEASAVDGPAPAKKKALKWLLLGGIVVIVIVVQAVVTAVVLPHRSSSSDSTHKSEDKGHGTAEHHGGGDEHQGPEGEFAEVALGDFSFSNGTAAPGVIIHVDFKLSAVASSKHASNLESQIKTHTARIRQAVNKIVRSSSLEEMNDPNLGTIKRLIREEINRLLQKTYVIEVVITDVRIMEQ